jgi:hypothetical protein
MHFRSVFVRLPLAVFGLLSLVAVPAAQQFVLSSQDRARLIAVDFAVIGADGRPVSDLRADEVTLKIDGKARPIRSLEYVSLASPAHTPGDVMRPPYGSNAINDGGRSVVLVIDQETIRPGRTGGLKAEINTFLQDLGPRDRVALMTVPYGGLKVDLTTEHHLITRALGPIIGQASAAETSDEAECRTITTLGALRGTFDDLRGGEAPVSVVLFSGHLASPEGVFAVQKNVTVGCQLRTEQFRQVSAAAAAAHAQFYVVLPELLVNSNSRAGLEHLAGVVGGQLLHLGGAENSALARVARETAGYYLARVEPEPSETNGELRGFSVSVARPETTVRQRPQMSVTRSSARFVNATALTPLDMMKVARTYRDLPLRVTGYSSREPGSSLIRVVTTFESPDPSAALSTAMVGLFDGDGRMAASAQLTSTELLASPVVAAMAVPPGDYRLRVAAAENAGRGGTADIQVNAGLASAGPLTMSALVVGLSRDGHFLPRLEFGSEASAIAYVEIYGAREGTAVGASFEIAHSTNGPAIATLPGVFSATNDPDRFIVTATVPLGALKPGDYMIRATIAAEGAVGGRVLRPLRKVSRP